MCDERNSSTGAGFTTAGGMLRPEGEGDDARTDAGTGATGDDTRAGIGGMGDDTRAGIGGMGVEPARRWSDDSKGCRIFLEPRGRPRPRPAAILAALRLGFLIFLSAFRSVSW